jgi:hypothetical protein
MSELCVISNLFIVGIKFEDIDKQEFYCSRAAADEVLSIFFFER